MGSCCEGCADAGATSACGGASGCGAGGGCGCAASAPEAATSAVPATPAPLLTRIDPRAYDDRTWGLPRRAPGRPWLKPPKEAPLVYGVPIPPRPRNAGFSFRDVRPGRPWLPPPRPLREPPPRLASMPPPRPSQCRGAPSFRPPAKPTCGPSKPTPPPRFPASPSPFPRLPWLPPLDGLVDESPGPESVTDYGLDTGCDVALPYTEHPDSGRTGIDFTRFVVMKQAFTDDLGELRSETGTALQIFMDLRRLGVSFLRDIGEADTTLQNLWRGCWTFYDLLSAANSWSFKPVVGAWTGPPGAWQCNPSSKAIDIVGGDVYSVPSLIAWTPSAPPPAPECPSALEPHYDGTVAQPCALPDDAPPTVTTLVQHLGLATSQWRTVAVPRWLGRSDRHGASGEASDCDFGDYGPPDSYFDWEWIDNYEGSMEDRRPCGAHFALTTVFEYPSNEDTLAREFARQIFAVRDPTDAYPIWRHPDEVDDPLEEPYTWLPYLLLGNELDQHVSAERIAWLILRTGLHMQEFGVGGKVHRIFPSLYSPGNDTADPTDPDRTRHYIRATTGVMDRIFFEIIRAALVLYEAEAAKPLLNRDVALMARLNDQLGGSNLHDFWLDLNADLGLGEPAELGQDEADFDYQRDVLAALARTRLAAPFEVMDFHWYSNNMTRHYRSHEDGGEPDDPEAYEFGEQEGKFLYLSKVAGLLEGATAEDGSAIPGIRATLAAWWTNGSSMPIWCSETGISSHKNWDEIRRILARWSDAVVPADECGVLNFARTRIEPSGYNVEFRVDPWRLRAEFAPHGVDIMLPTIDTADGNLSGSYENYGTWPAWAFTDEMEQAKQVWTRLSYMAALGVAKTIWWSYLGDVWQNECGVHLNQFYGYGLTKDTEDLAGTTGGSAPCRADELPGCVTWTGEEDPELGLHESLPEVTVPLMERPKKPAFCAMRRWNQYLDRYVSATFLTDGEGRRFDGNHPDHPGFYVVVFARHPESQDYDRYPTAAVVWADAQAYDWSQLDAIDLADPATVDLAMKFPPKLRALPPLYFNQTADAYLEDDLSDHADDDFWVLDVPALPNPVNIAGPWVPLCSPCVDSFDDEVVPDVSGSETAYDGKVVLYFDETSTWKPRYGDAGRTWTLNWTERELEVGLYLLPVGAWLSVEPLVV